MVRTATLAIAVFLLAAPALALEPREGWRVHPTQKSYQTLLSDLKAAIRAEEMGLVTEAGPTGAAAARGIEIPGNRVVGVFRNDFAVRILRLSTAAMIEAPVRFYVSEEADGTGTLSYKTPGFVFAPYIDEGGADLEAAAEELDTIFDAIADRARGPAKETSDQ
ncbi:DUF302 domain-containing protein [Roseovarius sp. D22-M7]|uniref:DUF302 domain-containing protein n=1 Tax=Roseovarius sp. D22-M7 TaxID=3127116 RepID=UPI00300FEE47